MGRRRKIAVANEEKENDGSAGRWSGGERISSANSMMLHGPIYTIMSNVQLNETNHKKYIKELKQLYAKMDHDAFMFTFIKVIKTAMAADEGNEYAETTLLFCAKFISSYDCEETHPLLIDMCKWLLTTISKNPHIRFRLCQFVNMILKALGFEAALDDAICDGILEYMLNRLRDTSSNVRVQAILAMQRLQVPDNPDDAVLRVYQFHLSSDPSSRVRQAVITCMGRNYHTIPYILERLWDIDEKVRRHTYLHMSSYPVRSYKVSQRLTLLQQGLNDRSESVRKVVINIMLQQWIESYQKDLIALLAALKLDSNEAEIERFRKVAKQTLKEIFKRQKKDELIACIPLEEDGEMHRCVPHDKLTIEIALYWQCLTEYLQAEMAEEFDLVVPELSTFCVYVEKFCESQTADISQFELMNFQYKLLSLIEILYTFDLGDEIGRGNLQKLLAHLLKNFSVNEKVIEVIVRCAENLITDQNARLQYFVEIIKEICDLNGKQNDLLHDRHLISELLASSSDADLNLKVSSLKVKILDLEEQEMNYMQRKEYTKAQQLTEKKQAASEEYANLLRPLLAQHPHAETLKQPLQLRKAVKPESVLKSLQITFYMVVSPKVSSLNPSILNLYNDFICRHLASSQIATRDWALKCGTACSMLYEALAKDVFDVLYAQFFKNHNIRIWETAITCIFELLDRYGLDNFVVQEEQNKAKKSGRQLYNTLEYLDSEDDSCVAALGQGVGVIYMMSHFLDTCDEVCITSAIVIGFCRLILRGYIQGSEITEKLLLRYFNPSTDSKINQILGVFLENLIQRKKQGVLQRCLLPMVTTVLSAPYENPLHDIRPDTITRFIIDATRQETSPVCDGHIHNKLAETFLDEMWNNLNNKELCKLLAKEIITLELNVTQNDQLKTELKRKADKLIKSDFDSRTLKSLMNFKEMLDGNFSPTRKPPAPPNDSEGEEESNDETEAEGKEDDETETASTATEKHNNKNGATASMIMSQAESGESEELTGVCVTTATDVVALVSNADATAVVADATAVVADATAVVADATAVVADATAVVADATAVVADATAVVTDATAVVADADVTALPTDTDVTALVSDVVTAVVSAPKVVATTAEVTPSPAPVITTKEISPSTRTPTTYGRENKVGHRYLRKSLNMSRGQSDNEMGDGPPRSPKIRIEARIDSDKKAEQSTDQRRAEASRNTRARRNLRYADKNDEADTAAHDSTLESAAKEQRPARTQPVQSSTTHKPSEQHSARTEGSKVSKMPVRASARKAQRTVESTQKAARSRSLEPVNEGAQSADNELNASDVIPASPVVASPHTTMTRLRRRIGTKEDSGNTKTPALSRPSTRNQSAQPTKKPQSAAKSSASNNGAPTPPRSGRKRSLQVTPRNATAASPSATAEDDLGRSSPSLKRLRTSSLSQAAAKAKSPPRPTRANTPKKQTTETTPPRVGSVTQSTRSTTRRRTLTTQQQRRSGKNVATSRPQRPIDAEATDSQSSQPSQSSNDVASKRARSSISPAALSDRTNKSSATEEGSATVRNSARRRNVRSNSAESAAAKQQLESVGGRVTHHGTSLGGNSGTSTTPSAAPAPARVLRGNSSTKVAASKIPVKVAAKVPKTEPVNSATSLASAVASSSSGTSASSYSDDQSKAIRAIFSAIPVTRKRALTTKMTRIQLTQKHGVPVPMQVARPTRVPTPTQHLRK